MEGRSEGASELILAVFRLAVADYLGSSYSHDGCAPVRKASNRFKSDAAIFLTSIWAGYLADLGGFEASAVWREVCYLDQTARPGRRDEKMVRTAA